MWLRALFCARRKGIGSRTSFNIFCLQYHENHFYLDDYKNALKPNEKWLGFSFKGLYLLKYKDELALNGTLRFDN